MSEKSLWGRGVACRIDPIGLQHCALDWAELSLLSGAQAEVYIEASPPT
jgi:hypothetical protein